MTDRKLRPVTDDLPAPRTDEDSAIIVSDAADALATLRSAAAPEDCLALTASSAKSGLWRAVWVSHCHRHDPLDR